MDDQKATDPQVTDQEIDAIISSDEAGVGDLLAAYEPIERDYFNAVQPSTVTVTTSAINTTE